MFKQWNVNSVVVRWLGSLSYPALSEEVEKERGLGGVLLAVGQFTMLKDSKGIFVYVVDT